jgi:hypothetical protein
MELGVGQVGSSPGGRAQAQAAQPVNKPSIGVVGPAAAPPPGGGTEQAAVRASAEAPAAVRAAALDLASFLTSVNRSLSVAVEEQTNMTVISVRDRDTGELVREIPPKKIVDAMRVLADLRASDDAAAETVRGLLLEGRG